MTETLSQMLPLGTRAADFNLLDVVTHQMVSLQNVKSDVATVIMFICNHCPYVRHIQHHLVDVANQYQAKGIQFVAINSNDIKKYPTDSPEKMAEQAIQHGFSFPYLYDETQAVAKAYQAACTPDFFIFDRDLKCVYRGRFDNASPGNLNPVTGKDLINALENILNGKAVSTDQKPSMGCNIKWK